MDPGLSEEKTSLSRKEISKLLVFIEVDFLLRWISYPSVPGFNYKLPRPRAMAFLDLWEVVSLSIVDKMAVPNVSFIHNILDYILLY